MDTQKYKKKHSRANERSESRVIALAPGLPGNEKKFRNFAVNMKRIDRETVQRILDTADIVEVVSDFVQLKRRGTNWVGLCPFHDDRSPSFYVSRAKGICKCFSCGKSASAVGFIMEHESLTYSEALRYLAKKYGIEIKERELTDSERAEADARETLLAVSDFAVNHFEQNLSTTADGRDIGLAYFRHRGINDAMIKRFRLGYALERSDALYKAAREKGFTDKALTDSGLCIHTDSGTFYDRFRGRVIYPVFSMSGRVIAFGGRTLRTEKTLAKYVNSPESAIYSKSRELYGLYQAKNAISRLGKCILVEGYMDVISMHQSGVENVVASSGTSLTNGQIKLIKRFTPNVTVIYDSDAAGIKASLRGINLLLEEGMNIKVVLLPDGDDPDSFAQSHSASEVEQYISDHEVDFIRFKTDILLKDAGDDPVTRASVIKDIVESISVIPDPVTRTVYLQDCARRLQIDEKVLSLQIDKATAERAEKKSREQQYQQAAATLDRPLASTSGAAAASAVTATPSAGQHEGTASRMIDTLVTTETQLVKYSLRYGLFNIEDEIEGEVPVNVHDYIMSELAQDNISFSWPPAVKLMEAITNRIRDNWPADRDSFRQGLTARLGQERSEGINRIAEQGGSLDDMQAREAQLSQSLDLREKNEMDAFTENYLVRQFVSDPDDDIRALATSLASERYVLSKLHTRMGHVPTERERLPELVPRAVLELKNVIVERKINDLRAQLSGQDAAHQADILAQIQSFTAIRSTLATLLGERTITP